MVRGANALQLHDARRFALAAALTRKPLDPLFLDVRRRRSSLEESLKLLDYLHPSTYPRASHCCRRKLSPLLVSSHFAAK